MGLFNIFRKKFQNASPKQDAIEPPEQEPAKNQQQFSAQTKQNVNTQQSQALTSLTSKENLQRAIRTMAQMSKLFIDSTNLKAIEGGRNQKMMSIMHSYSGMLGYLYEFTYKYGSYSDLVSKEMGMHFVLVLSVMKDDNHRKQSLKNMAMNWSDVLYSVVILQGDNTPEGNQMLQLQPEIDFVTKVIEAVSGSKCDNPKDCFEELNKNKLNEEKYAKMVEEATFNPLKITNDPALQNNPPLPDFFFETFKKELSDLYNALGFIQIGPKEAKDFFRGYVGGLVESYYENAGYVPKTTVDAIIKDCYKAVQQTQCCKTLGTLDEVMYWVYYGFLNR